MQSDPDLNPSNTQTETQPPQVTSADNLYASSPQGVYSHPLTEAYSQGPVTNVNIIVVYLATFFTSLNIVFLILGALYSFGVYGEEIVSNSSSYFVTAVMVLIAGSLGLTSAVIGIHLSKAFNMFKVALINRIFLISTVVLAILILIGPVIN